jgi:hypothetical protein
MIHIWKRKNKDASHEKYNDFSLKGNWLWLLAKFYKLLGKKWN